MVEFKKNKPTRSVDHQLALLKERGLVVKEEDEISIKKSIREIGYFRLSGYFSPLQHPKDTFKEGTTFSDILRLYEFDRKLRVMTSYAVKSIELKLKARITDIMSSDTESDWYTNRTLFHAEKTTKEVILVPFVDDNCNLQYENRKVEIKIYDAVIKKINESIKRNKETAYIKKFRSEYGDEAIVPSWMMMECISFGTLSKLYSIIKPTGTTKNIHKYFDGISPEIFSSWVHNFVILRNHCAHHARLWNIRPTLGLRFPEGDAVFSTEANSANHNLFYGISGCLLKALKESDEELYIHYKENFNKLIDEYKIDKGAMGFPTSFAPHDIWT